MEVAQLAGRHPSETSKGEQFPFHSHFLMTSFFAWLHTMLACRHCVSASFVARVFVVGMENATNWLAAIARFCPAGVFLFRSTWSLVLEKLRDHSGRLALNDCFHYGEQQLGGRVRKVCMVYVEIKNVKKYKGCEKLIFKTD